MKLLHPDLSVLLQGFRAVMPLWLAAAPFALAFTVASQQAGLSALEIQLMSLTVYSAAAQIAAVQLASAGASSITILATAVTMNLHQLLYGWLLARRMKLSRAQRAIGAYLLTDAAFGVTVTAGNKATFSFLLGAELSLFLAWNGFTALSLVFGHLVTIPASAHLDFIVPLTFFALLISTIKTRLHVAVAILSASATLLCLSIQVGNATVIIVGFAGALVGTWFSEHWTRSGSLAVQRDTK